MGKSGVAVLAFVLGAGLAGAGSATAARLITGKDIKNGSITSKDLSKGVNAQLQRTGQPGPKGDPGPQGDKGANGISLFTFADSSVSGGITLSGNDQVVTSTAQQIDEASGAIGGPLAIPAGPGRYVTTSTLRIRTQGSGSYTCTLQLSANGGQFFSIDGETSSVSVLRVPMAEGSFLNNAPVSRNYRVVCSGAATRVVIDADLTVIAAVQPL
jgi:hypothetical protein